MGCQRQCGLHLLVLPGADTGPADTDQHRGAGEDADLKPILPALPGPQVLLVEPDAQVLRLEPAAQFPNLGLVGAVVGEEGVVVHG